MTKQKPKKEERDIKNQPSFLTTSGINIDGLGGNRSMAVYRTTGCSYAKKGGGCAMCGLKFYADPNISEQNIKKQHAKILKILRNKKNNFIQFDLLTLGNFFDDSEFSPELRKYLLTTIAEISSIKRVLTESRRSEITIKKLQRARKCLRDDQILEYALGYETITPKIRNQILRKGVPERHLDEALDICKKAGVDFVAYVLIKPPTLSESESIKEAINTALHVLQKAKTKDVTARVAFEPVFVTKGNILEELFLKGQYTPPKLWSIVEVIKQTAKKLKTNNTKGKLFIGLSSENLSVHQTTENCGKCDKHVIEAIQKFNQTQDISIFKNLDCKCKN